MVGDNTPRFDHDAATGECKGLLIEEGRKNYLENGDFVSSYGSGNFWTYGVGTDVFSASSGSQLSTNPDGSSPAYHYAPSSTAGYHRFYRTVTVDAYDTSYVASVFVKRVTAGSASNLNRYFEIELSGNLSNNPEPTGHSGSHGMSSVTFDLQDLTSQYAGNSAVKVNGLVGDPKIEDYGNGWYRLSYVFNPGQFDANSTLTAHMWLGHPATLGSEAGNEQGNGNPSFYIWGAMVEKGSFLTSYIPNHSGFQNTRGKDVVRIEGQEFTDFYDTSEWTLLTITDATPASLVRSPSSVNDIGFIGTDGNNYYKIRYVTDSTLDDAYIDAYGTSNSSVQFDFGGTHNEVDTSALRNVKTAFAAKVNDTALTYNGNTVEVDTGCALPLNVATFYIGESPKQLYVKRIMYYPKRLSNAQLVTLTS